MGTKKTKSFQNYTIKYNTFGYNFVSLQRAKHKALWTRYHSNMVLSPKTSISLIGSKTEETSRLSLEEASMWCWFLQDDGGNPPLSKLPWKSWNKNRKTWESATWMPSRFSQRKNSTTSLQALSSRVSLPQWRKDGPTSWNSSRPYHQVLPSAATQWTP